MLKNKLATLILFIMIGPGCSRTNMQVAEPTPPIEPELTQPLFAKKMVIAHNMTHMIHIEGKKDTQTGPWREFSPNTENAKDIGGSYQVMSFLNVLGERQTLDEAVEYEINTAIEMGLDGFQFFYPATAKTRLLNKFDKIITAYIRVAEAIAPDFKIAITICNPDPNLLKQDPQNPPEIQELDIQELQNKAVKQIGNRIKKLVEVTNHSKIWLRSTDNRLVTFIWLPQGLVSGEYGLAQLQKQSKAFSKLADLFDKIEEFSGEDIAYVYHLNEPGNEKYLSNVLDRFPAIWGWTTTLDDNNDEWKQVAKITKKRNRAYTQSTDPDHYTSKLYQTDENNKVIKKLFGGATVHDFNAIGIDNLLRYTHVTKLSESYRRQLALAVETDAQLINFISWNDYPEGHHLAPEVNSNFSRAVLLKYYKELWKSGTSIPEKDKAVVFYKKYPAKAVPQYNIKLAYKLKLDNAEPDVEDVVEVVTMLTEPADIYYNGTKIGTGEPGINTHTAPMEIGSVNIEIKRDTITIIELNPPMKIVDKPYRTDRVLVGYSSEYDKYYDKIFSKYPNTFQHPPVYEYDDTYSSE